MKIFFAGAESNEHRKSLLEIGVKNILLTFYYLKDKNDEKIKEMFDELKKENINIFLDSGAFSFMYSSSEKPSFEVLEDYVKEYILFLKKYKDYLEIYVELDVDKVIGLENTLKLRQNMIDEGLNPVLVHHFETRTDEMWEEACKNNKIVAMGSIAQGEQLNIGKIASLLNIANKYKTKVHGFGFTRLDLLNKLKFYSVDSTSWLGGNKFGQTETYYFDGKQLREYSQEDKNIRLKFKELCEKIGVDFEKLIKDDGREVRKFNTYNWKIFSDYLENESKNSDGIKIKNGYDNSKFNAVKTGLYARHPEALEHIKCPKKCDVFMNTGKCVHTKNLKILEVKDLEDMKKKMLKLINFTGKRYVSGLIGEEQTEGLLDRAVDRVANNYAKYIETYQKLTVPQNEIIIKNEKSIVELMRDARKELDNIDNKSGSDKETN